MTERRSPIPILIVLGGLVVFGVPAWIARESVRDLLSAGRDFVFPPPPIVRPVVREGVPAAFQAELDDWQKKRAGPCRSCDAPAGELDAYSETNRDVETAVVVNRRTHEKREILRILDDSGSGPNMDYRLSTAGDRIFIYGSNYSDHYFPDSTVCLVYAWSADKLYALSGCRY